MEEYFLSQQRDQENGNNEGWRHDQQKFFPYNSVEGGTQTIGYGHKLSKHEQNTGVYRSGITKQEAISIQIREYKESRRNAEKIFINSQKSRFQDCSIGAQFVAADLVFNVGENGFRKYKKYMEAMKKNDLEGMIQESKSHVTLASGEKREMKRRNEFRKFILQKYRK